MQARVEVPHDGSAGHRKEDGVSAAYEAGQDRPENLNTPVQKASRVAAGVLLVLGTAGFIPGITADYGQLSVKGDGTDAVLAGLLNERGTSPYWEPAGVADNWFHLPLCWFICCPAGARLRHIGRDAKTEAVCKSPGRQAKAGMLAGTGPVWGGGIMVGLWHVV